MSQEMVGGGEKAFKHDSIDSREEGREQDIFEFTMSDEEGMEEIANEPHTEGSQSSHLMYVCFFCNSQHEENEECCESSSNYLYGDGDSEAEMTDRDSQLEVNDSQPLSDDSQPRSMNVELDSSLEEIAVDWGRESGNNLARSNYRKWLGSFVHPQ